MLIDEAAACVVVQSSPIFLTIRNNEGKSTRPFDTHFAESVQQIFAVAVLP